MIDLGIRRPITILMIVIALLMFSVIMFREIPVELNPNMQSGVVSVITRMRGGVAATEIEKYVTRPLEEAFSEIPGIREIISSSRESESNIMMRFRHDINTDFAVVDVRERIAMVAHRMPREAERPIIARFQQSDAPIIIISLSSVMFTPEQLRDIAENQIIERLMRVSGVANIEIGGGRARKLLIDIDNNLLLAHRLPILEVVQMINTANISISAGTIDENSTNYVIRATGEFTDIEEIGRTGIAITPAGSVIRLNDIATVRDYFYEPTSFARLNAQPVVSLFIQRESEANTISTAAGVMEIIDYLRYVIDPHIAMTVVKNDAEYIIRAVSALTEALVIGGILLAGILFLFMRNTKNILIIASTMPLSLFMSIILLRLFNQTFNVMTLSGLAMGMASVMDSAIVVVENVSYHHHKKT